MPIGRKTVWGLIAAVVLLAAGARLVYVRLTDESLVRAYVVAFLREVFQSPHVAVAQARRRLSGNLTLEGLTVQQEIAGRPLATLEIRKVWVDVVGGLFSTPTGVRQIMLDDVIVRVERYGRHDWNLLHLLKPGLVTSATPGPLPLVVVSNGQAFLADSTTSERIPMLHLSGFEFQLKPDPTGRTYEVDGRFRADSFSTGRFKGTFDPRTLYTRVQGTLEGLALSPRLRDRLAPELRPWWDRLLPSTGHVTLWADLTHDPVAAEPLAWRVEAEGTDLTVAPSGLPSPLYDLHVHLLADSGHVEVRDLTGRLGAATLSGQAELSRLDPEADGRLAAKVSGLVLNREVRQCLPAAWQRWWDRLAPSGRIDLAGRLQRTAGRWAHDLTITCQEVQIAPPEFPYPVHRITGSIQVRGDRVELALDGQAGLRPVRLAGHVTGQGADAQVDLKLTGSEVPIDQTLLAALDAKTANSIREFGLEGAVDVEARLWRAPGADQTVAWSVEAALKGCRSRYVDLPYPVSGLTGTVRVYSSPTAEDPDRYIIEAIGLSGSNDMGVFSGRGRQVATARWCRLEAEIRGRHVAFEPELRASLSPSWQRVWDLFQPQGVADFAATVQVQGPWRTPVTVAVDLDLKQCDLTYVGFPYEFRKVSGQVRFRPDRVELVGLHSDDEAMRVGLEGEIRPLEGQPTLVDLRRVKIEGAPPRGPWQRRFPAGFSRAWDRLNLQADRQSLVVRDGRLQMALTPGDNRVVWAEWLAPVEAAGLSVSCGVPLSHMRGTMRLEGSYRDGHVRGAGPVELETLELRDRPLSNVTAQVRLDDEALVFQDLRGEFYGGRVTGEARFVWREPFTYQARLSLSGASIQEAVQASLDREHPVSGRLSGTLNLQGHPGADSPRGEGMLSISQADLVRLPLVLAIAKLLDFQLPDRRGFQEASIRYYVKGPQVVLEDIVLEGAGLSFRGHGTMTLAGELDLRLETSVAGSRPALLQGVTRQLARVHVEGPWTRPRVTVDPVPPVSGPLRKLVEMLD